jgi:hypothetical protein
MTVDGCTLKKLNTGFGWFSKVQHDKLCKRKENIYICYTIGAVPNSSKDNGRSKLYTSNIYVWPLNFLLWYRHLKKKWWGQASFMGPNDCDRTGVYTDNIQNNSFVFKFCKVVVQHIRILFFIKLILCIFVFIFPNLRGIQKKSYIANSLIRSN